MADRYTEVKRAWEEGQERKRQQAEEERKRQQAEKEEKEEMDRLPIFSFSGELSNSALLGKSLFAQLAAMELAAEEEEEDEAERESERSLKTFRTVQKHLELLFANKSIEYGRAYEFTGARGAAVALTGDVAKLRWLLRAGEPDMINIMDKFRDVAVQAIIGIMMVQADNMEGR